jgi:hypothetical protein
VALEELETRHPLAHHKVIVAVLAHLPLHLQVVVEEEQVKLVILLVMALVVMERLQQLAVHQ